MESRQTGSGRRHSALVSQQDSSADAQAAPKFRMQRSVSQLLFSYLPGKTVDWEDGVAIMQLTNVRLASAWSADRAKLVFGEIAEYLQRWRTRGLVHPSFPDPTREEGQFTVGEPEAIEADMLDTALQCLSCSRLVFAKQSALARQDGAMNPYTCPTCGKGPLRQFPQVFVHGCGHLGVVGEWMPSMKRENGIWKQVNYKLECKNCGPRGIPQISGRSERARDLIVTCKRCQSEITLGRLNSRCPECVRALGQGRLPVLQQPHPPSANNRENDASMGEVLRDDEGRSPTAVAQVAMRITSYRASEAYYGHTLTILRLDRPEIAYLPDEDVELLRRLIPSTGGTERPTDKLSVMQRLVAEASSARDRGDEITANRLLEQIQRVVSGEEPVKSSQTPIVQLSSAAPDLRRAISESLALKTTVRARAYTEVLQTVKSGATAGLEVPLRQRHQDLGLRPTHLIEDLPVITATFGYTRRSFEPTYEEYDGSLLPTQLRPFFSLDSFAAKRLGKPNAAGTVPILAREGEHEGLFLSLDADRVLLWLSRNGIRLADDGRAAIARILEACESVDRYYDTINSLPVRRLVFGLIHSLSHAAMRLVSQAAGLERTSISEYLFLPLLGTVVYANNSSFRMGAIETLLRSTMYEFLENLDDEAMTCLFDPDCLDHRGACAGCLHAPEICCRVFNHGLSRAFLIGGHAPWEDVSVHKRIIGYWEP